MERMGLCNRLRPEKAEEYKRLHAAAWPRVLATGACPMQSALTALRRFQPSALPQIPAGGNGGIATMRAASRVPFGPQLAPM